MSLLGGGGAQRRRRRRIQRNEVLDCLVGEDPGGEDDGDVVEVRVRLGKDRFGDLNW